MRLSKIQKNVENGQGQQHSHNLIYIFFVMQLKHIESLIPPSPGIVKVTAICWSPNAKKLAVCTTEKLVLMFDENGARKDKFATKAIDKVSVIFIYSILYFSIYHAPMLSLIYIF